MVLSLLLFVSLFTFILSIMTFYQIAKSIIVSGTNVHRFYWLLLFFELYTTLVFACGYISLLYILEEGSMFYLEFSALLCIVMSGVFVGITDYCKRDIL